MEDAAATIRNRLMQIDQRLRDISEIICASDSVKRLQPIKDKSNDGFSSQKANFINAHTAELAEYNKAYRTLMKWNGDSRVDADALSREAAVLNQTKAHFMEMQEDAKPRLAMMRKVRKCVQAVWTWLGKVAERTDCFKSVLPNMNANAEIVKAASATFEKRMWR